MLLLMDRACKPLEMLSMKVFVLIDIKGKIREGMVIVHNIDECVKMFVRAVIQLEVGSLLLSKMSNFTDVVAEIVSIIKMN